MTDQKKAYLYAAATIMLWSTVATAFKISLRELDFIQFLFVAALSSTLALWGISLFSKQKSVLRKSTAAEICRSALMGLLNPLAYYLVLFKAYDLLPAQEAQPLNWTWPIVLSLMSALFLKQRLGWQGIVAVCLSFVGVLVISTHGNIFGWQFTNPAGDLLAVGSSFIWATYWIMNLNDRRDPVVKLAWNFTFGSAYALIAVLIFSEFPKEFSTSLLAAIFVGFVEMGFAFVFWLKALSLAERTSTVAIFAYLTPFISLIFISSVLGETIRASSILGLILIIIGILLQMTSRVNNKH